MHRWLRCDVGVVHGAKACGAGVRVRVRRHGARARAVWRGSTARRVWATIDALAALCVPEGQAGQPESQEESQLESE